MFIVLDRRTAWWLRLLAVSVVAYVLSPVDLVLDFIPLLGVLDDAALVVLVFCLLERLTPAEVLAEAGARADDWARRPARWLVGALIALCWLSVGVLLLRSGWRWLAGLS